MTTVTKNHFTLPITVVPFHIPKRSPNGERAPPPSLNAVTARKSVQSPAEQNREITQDGLLTLRNTKQRKQHHHHQTTSYFSFRGLLLLPSTPTLLLRCQFKSPTDLTKLILNQLNLIQNIVSLSAVISIREDVNQL